MVEAESKPPVSPASGLKEQERGWEAGERQFPGGNSRNSDGRISYF